jgi:hypothetical protein
MPAPAALAALRATIQASLIRVRGHSAARADWLAGGYDGTDQRILDWIASHRGGQHRRPLLH